MKAAVLVLPNQDLQITELKIPPLNPGQVLVEIKYSGLCRSQLMEISGGRGVDHYLPHLLGHEACAKVIECGAGVKKVSKDDWVILTWIKSKGCDVISSSYEGDNGIQVNSGAVTTFSDYAVVSENRCVLKPDFLTPEHAVLFGCALPTGMGIVLNELKPRPHSTVAVFGLGGIGMAALIALLYCDDVTIIAIDCEESKLSLAKEFGAHVAINSTLCDPLKEISRLTDKQGVDYAIDASGVCSVIEQAFKSVKDNGGLCIFASHPPADQKICLDPHDFIRGKRIQGSWGGACQPDRDIPIFAEMLRDFPLGKLLSKPYSLLKINDAIKDLADKKVLRPLIKL
jgi:S-(hydroxymethyl)glutathione dehydrogenase / alcohol dehydrogenase